MAGLLDKREGKLTPWQRFIRPQAASKEDVNEGYYANQMGLLGSGATDIPNTDDTVSYGLMDGQQTQPQYNAQGPGTGYLGGQIGLNEYNMRSDANAARYYGEGPVKQGMANRQSGYNNQNTNQAAMGRQLQKQAYEANNMTAYQAGQLQNSTNTLNNTEANQNFNQAIQVRDRFMDDNAQNESSVYAAKTMDEMFPEGDYSISGSAQLAGVMKFMKQQNDGGAFMSDDMLNSARANGFIGQMKDLGTWAISSGFKAPSFMRDMHKIMATQAEAGARENKALRDRVRKGYGDRFNNQGYDAIFSGSALGSNGTYVRPSHLAEDGAYNSELNKRLKPYRVNQ